MDLLQLESIFATQIEIRVTNLLGGQFPGLSFTTEVSEKSPSFPNVYIHELEPSEVGNSIPNKTIHAIRSTVQIEATSNVSKTDARKVINACINACKMMSYGVTAFPIYSKTNNVHRYIIRVRRVIANGDTF